MMRAAQLPILSGPRAGASDLSPGFSTMGAVPQQITLSLSTWHGLPPGCSRTCPRWRATVKQTLGLARMQSNYLPSGARCRTMLPSA